MRQCFRGDAESEPALNLPLGGKLQPKQRAPQRPDIAVGFEIELPAQGADIADDAVRRSDRFRRRGKSLAVEIAPVSRPDPQPEQDQIDIEAGTVLQRDQRLGDTGPRIQRQRETPERLAGARREGGSGGGCVLLRSDRVPVHDNSAIRAI